MKAFFTTATFASLSFLAPLAAVGCAATDEASESSTLDGRTSDELTLWKRPDGTPVPQPPPSPSHGGREVGVGLPGLVCTSFSQLALSAEVLCRREGLALLALKPDGFCGEVPLPDMDGGAAPSDPSAPIPGDAGPAPVPGPGPVPGPVPPQWGFDHAVGMCGYNPPPPPPCGGPGAPRCPPPPPCSPGAPCKG